MFRGHHQLSIDEKGRIAIPTAVRQKLPEDAPTQLIVTKRNDPCLELYPVAVFDEIAAAIQALPNQQHKQLLRRAWVGRAAEVEIDKQGRIVLPQLLRTEAGLNGTAFLVGQIDRLELWPDERWNEQYRDGPGSKLPDLTEAFQALNR